MVMAAAKRGELIDSNPCDEGQVFHDEAAALERRLLVSTNPSTRLSEPQPTSDEPAALQDGAAA